MGYKHCCVIDSDGNYRALVRVDTVNGNYEDAIVFSYQLQEGESLVDAGVPDTALLCKPQWDGVQWIESALKEEIAAWRNRTVEVY